MTLLSENELKKMMSQTPPLMENLQDQNTQIQPNGIEMTLKEIRTIKGTGSVDFDNKQRVIPEGETLEFDSEGWINLPNGIYKVIFNEIVNMPKNIAAIAKPRSSLIRCGVSLETAVWDAGYRGRSESMLVVHNFSGFRLKKNARIMQMLFYTLDSEVIEGYTGQYQNENV
ncbi:deoxyUTP pyrophosphatase [Methanohalobium evestigatum Z-7303]|uniref:Probable deoxyuridine 5'-triphosphate nucleotidohydrolase n=1 Tax=Methanohalobium evestigatum (strain ATCC BAA-1072 / DSM 3721 / NBRC 107634 / OCM 161 / Z-7303) TaxID=644295 RepID=D7EB35_METEZ|nr:deoxyuridine 5'-triphosphate nucleotidohydrolase [Methanohalobium evestigatum]ADI74552.1 deoxyUTP pyrophosphatase [Methanohalobium evestigatum Z-7303]